MKLFCWELAKKLWTVCPAVAGFMLDSDELDMVSKIYDISVLIYS